MKFITLLTDFGLRDGYVGVMKGVIYGIAPHAQIADISHTISPQNILEGALALGRVAPFFPPGAVHIAVIDPGVGTARRPIAARIGAHYFIGPDNGLFTVVLERAERSGDHIALVHLDRPRFWLPNVSNVFHGRDIFSPVGAHLANEIPLEDVGTPIENIARLELPRVEQSQQGFRGQVTSIDHFGNLATNIMREHLTGMDLSSIKVSLAGVDITGLVNTFGDRSSGRSDRIVWHCERPDRIRRQRQRSRAPERARRRASRSVWELSMQIVTLTTDFGAGDYEIGSMMGVIWSAAPTTRLVDLTHDIERHNIRQAALMLDRCTPYFPAGTIHLVVVDPGVGTKRRVAAARLGDQWFVGPDNGLFTLMLRRAQAAGKPVEIVDGNNRQYWLPQVSSIFHGRDVFASVAGHLAAGTPLSKVRATDEGSGAAGLP
jgi:S-adenosyl-L-methionine hydrolase (adenosine-forming)